MFQAFLMLRLSVYPIFHDRIIDSLSEENVALFLMAHRVKNRGGKGDR
jgi:hypothetical protein